MNETSLCTTFQGQFLVFHKGSFQIKGYHDQQCQMPFLKSRKATALAIDIKGPVISNFIGKVEPSY